ncbi:hypothetical protein TNCV_239171 [Trichonephila clavipes]|nr:hypothetical protein TNCV_239171 [Trichonephila clavipes]
MPSDQWSQIEVQDIHYGKGLGEKPGGGQGLNRSSPSTNLSRGFAVRWLFRVPPGRKSAIHLQTSRPSPGIEPRPYDTAVSVSNIYTG